MRGIISIFENLINIIKTAWQIVSNLFNAIGTLLQIVQQIITTEITLTADMPSWLITFIMSSIAISILFVILGRNGGKSHE